MLVSGCASPLSNSPSQITVTVGTLRQSPIPTAILRAASDLRADYAHSDWSSVRQTVTDSGTRGALLAELERWKVADVGGLTVGIVNSKRLGRGRYVETLEFSSDPRAVPAFGVYVFAVHAGKTRIVGSPSGLRDVQFTRANWAVTRSKHFVVLHGPYQLAGKDRAYLADLEYQRATFARKFGVRLPPLADYYLYPTVAVMSRMTNGSRQACGIKTDNIACANPYVRPPTIQSAIWPTYHEPIHIYQSVMEPKGYVDPLFISEGMAVALEDREVDPNLSDYCSDLAYHPLDECARYALNVTQPMSLLPDKGFLRADPSAAYSLAGSFVKYLIQHGGYQRFGHFYYVLAAQPLDRERDYDVAAEAVYHESIRRLVSSWSSEL